MKKIIELTVTHKERVKREIEFPVYSKHDVMPDGADSIYYHRVDSSMRRVTVHYSLGLSGESWEIEKSDRFSFSGNSEDYSLGLGEFASSAEEFNEALESAIKFAESMRPTGE